MVGMAGCATRSPTRSDDSGVGRQTPYFQVRPLAAAPIRRYSVTPLLLMPRYRLTSTRRKHAGRLVEHLLPSPRPPHRRKSVQIPPKLSGLFVELSEAAAEP